MSVADFLAGSDSKSFKFDTIGSSVTGTVVNAEVVQTRNFDSGALEFWDDGKPKQQIRVTLQTTLRDPADPDDTGVRSVFVKGWGDPKKELIRALKAAGAKDVHPGGTFTATYVRDGERPAGKRGGFPPKVYTYQFVAPSGTAALLDDPSASQTPPAAPAALPVQPPQLTAEQAEAYTQYLAQQQSA